MWTILDSKPADGQIPDLDEPLALGPPVKTHRRRWQTLGGLLVAAILLLTLPAQLIFVYVDELSQHPVYRPWLDSACAIIESRGISCQLPDRFDLTAFTAGNLQITDHPDYEDIRMLTMDITNQATFHQVLPALTIQFSAPDGDLVAARQLQAADYAADIATAGMAPGQTISIAIAFADPGNDAVNYRADFSRPQGIRP